MYLLTCGNRVCHSRHGGGGCRNRGRKPAHNTLEVTEAVVRAAEAPTEPEAGVGAVLGAREALGASSRSCPESSTPRCDEPLRPPRFGAPWNAARVVVLCASC